MTPGKDLNVTITKEEFKGLLSEPLGRIMPVLEKALTKAGLTFADIDEIILAGGGSRLTVIKELLQEKIGDPAKVNAGIDYDRSISIGATIYCITQLNKDKDSV